MFVPIGDPTLFDKVWPELNSLGEEKFKLIQLKREKREIPNNVEILLVTFTNNRDPSSIKQITRQNFANVFGEGYRLVSIVLEITDEPITESDLTLVAPWMAQENPIFVDWHKYSSDHPLRTLNKFSFAKRS